MIHSKPHRGCRIQDPGTRSYRWWKTADFSHSARCAHPDDCPVPRMSTGGGRQAKTGHCKKKNEWPLKHFVQLILRFRTLRNATHDSGPYSLEERPATASLGFAHRRWVGGRGGGGRNGGGGTMPAQCTDDDRPGGSLHAGRLTSTAIPCDANHAPRHALRMCVYITKERGLCKGAQVGHIDLCCADPVKGASCTTGAPSFVLPASDINCT